MATLHVHLVPNAKGDKVVGEHGAAIKIKLRAPAVEGKANAALIRFLAEQLELPRSAIVLERGRTSRYKVIYIDNLRDKDVYRRLLGTTEAEMDSTAQPISKNVSDLSFGEPV